jgi:competence protein ComEC
MSFSVRFSSALHSWATGRRQELQRGWRTNPVLLPAGAFAVGIGLQAWAQAPLGGLLGAMGFCGVLLMAQRLRRLPGFSVGVLAVLCCMAGATTWHLRQPQYPGPLVSLQGTTYHLEAQVLETASPRQRGAEQRVRIRQVETPAGWQTLQGDVLIRWQGRVTDTLPPAGYRVRFRAELKPIPDSNGYTRYLRREGVNWQTTVHRWQILGPASGTTALLARWRQRLVARLSEVIETEPQQQTAAALLLGERAPLSRDLVHQYRDAGLLHVLALSGTHVSTVLTLLMLVLYGLRPWVYNRWLVAGLGIGLVIGYAALTGFSASVVRAALLGGLIVLPTALRRDVHPLNLLAACFLGQLLWNPALLWDVGFQLSYAAVLGLFLLPNRLSVYLPSRWLLLRVLRDLALVSFAAQLFVLPLLLVHFGNLSVYVLPANVVAHYVGYLGLLLGLLTLSIGWVPGLGSALGFLTEWTLYALNQLAGWFSALPGAVQAVSLSPGYAVLLGALILVGTLCLPLPLNSRERRLLV